MEKNAKSLSEVFLPALFFCIFPSESGIIQSNRDDPGFEIIRDRPSAFPAYSNQTNLLKQGK